MIPERYMVTAVPIDGGAKVMGNLIQEGSKYYIKTPGVCVESSRNHLINENVVEFYAIRIDPATIEERYYIGVHYGTANPCHMTLWSGGELLDEYYYDSRRNGRQLNDNEYFEELKKLASGKEIAAVIIDPSAASFRETVKRGGFNVQSANSVAEERRIAMRDILHLATELKEACIERTCLDCSLYQRWDNCNVTANHPSQWTIPRWTKQDLDDMEAILRVLPGRNKVYRSDDINRLVAGRTLHINPTLIPSLAIEDGEINLEDELRKAGRR